MIDKLRELKGEYESLSQEMAVTGKSPEQYQTYARRVKELAPIIAKFDELLDVEKTIADAKEILREHKEGELCELANEELAEATRSVATIKEQLSSLLSGRQKETVRGKTTGVIMEIRAGAGGQEAALFARDMYQMYSRFAEKRGWKIELMDYHRSEMGGFKEIILGLEGKDVYALMRHEGGVHRVQRIPVTESGGRIHTSTITVAVLPESEEIELQIDLKDLKIDTFRASGAGGQHVNVTDSAIRITHLPTGITVQCQDERSQHKNRAKAMRVLRARLLDHFEREKTMEIAKDRSAQVKTGDRSEKIRTYNFPQNRVTDHRVNLTLRKLDTVMKGDLDQLVSALQKM